MCDFWKSGHGKPTVDIKCPLHAPSNHDTYIFIRIKLYDVIIEQQMIQHLME